MIVTNYDDYVVLFADSANGMCQMTHTGCYKKSYKKLYKHYAVIMHHSSLLYYIILSPSVVLFCQNKMVRNLFGEK